MFVVLLLGVLSIAAGVGVGKLAIGIAGAAPGPPAAPTISSGPANPTSLTSATFAFSSGGATSYQCSIDAGAFTGCTSPKTYSAPPFAPGPHAFQVKAVNANGTSAATSYNWTVDTTAPTVSSINRADPNPSNLNPLHWTVTFSEPVSNVGVANFGLVTSGLGGTAPAVQSVAPASGPSATWTVTVKTTGTTAGAGSIQLNLTGKGTIQDAATNLLAGTPPLAGQAYTFDTAAPAAPAIASGPGPSPPSVASTSAMFTFTGEALATFLCKLDAGAFVACSSGVAYSGLAQGAHTFQVEAVDQAGNVGPVTSRTWTVDTTPPPAPSITSKPANPINSTSASFVFSDSEAGATFMCRLDAGAYASCTSPRSYSGLADGSRTFNVVALDSLGNTSAAATWTWLVDTTAPAVTISFPANGGIYGATTWNAGCVGGAGICGSATDPTGITSGVVSTLQLSTGKYWNGSSFSSATEVFTTVTPTGGSGTTFTGRYPLALPPAGSYTVHARSTDGVGNTNTAATQATANFTIDTTPPAAPAITSGPGPSPPSVGSTSATFTFTGEAGATFLCKLDGGAFSACSSGVSYTGLAQGSHTFQVEAVDQAGNIGPAASRTWTVDTVAPPVPGITSKPTDPSTSATASFAFNDSEAGVTFMCKIDGGAYASCTSPKSYGGLAQGSHTFNVLALDSVGNASAPATWTWTVDTIPPQVVSITRNDPSPTTAPSVSWTVTFSEPVKGVAANDFVRVLTGLGGNPTIGSVAPGSGTLAATFTVTASTGSGVGTLGLNLVDDDTVKDAAGNPLGGAGNGNGNKVGQVYAIDHVAPPEVVYTTFPSDPSSDTSPTFAWTNSATDIDHYECSAEDGPFYTCTSPVTLSDLAIGDHEFEVRAVDLAGNTGPDNEFHWKIKAGTGQPYTISGSVSSALYPGGAAQPINVAFSSTNVGNGGSGVNGVQVSSLVVAITSVTGGSNVPNVCTAADFALTQFSGAYPFYVPQGASSLSSLGFASGTWPKLTLINRPVNQDGCKGASINLSYTGTP